MSRPVSRNRRIIEIALAAGALLAIFVWLEGFLTRKVGADHPVPAPADLYKGEIHEVRSSEIPVLRRAVGTVRSVKEATISSRIQGVIERLLVEEGDAVRKGDDLAILSAPEIDARRTAASRAVGAAEAAALQARSDFERMERLLAREAVTVSEWEHARTALSIAEAELERARESARAEEALASYTRLRAPFDALVVGRRRDPGDLVSPGEPILRLVDPSRFRLEAAVQEGAGGTLRAGQAVTVILPSQGREIASEIDEVVPAADPASRTITVKVNLPAIEGLRTGQFGRLVLRAGTRPGVIVPREAVRTVGGLHLVTLVDEEGRRLSRHVRTGEEVPPDAIEILSGLAEGDRIVRDGKRAGDE